MAARTFYVTRVGLKQCEKKGMNWFALLFDRKGQVLHSLLVDDLQAINVSIALLDGLLVINPEIDDHRLDWYPTGWVVHYYFKEKRLIVMETDEEVL